VIPPATPVHSPSGWGGELVSAGELRVFVRHVGDCGDPVLCVHGLQGNSTNWTDLAGLLGRDFRVDALDLPGFGYSPPPASYSVTAQAQAVITTIEHHVASPVHLLGNSLGGAVAIRVAARRPDLVRTLGLISPVLPDRRPRWQVARFPLLALPWVGGGLMRRVAEVPPQARARATAAYVCHDPASIGPDKLAAEAAELARRDGLPYSDRAVIATVRSLVAEVLGTALWRDAAAVRAPVLAIFGSSDQLVDPRLAVRAARTFPNARVLVLPRTGHVAHMEHPAIVAREWARLVQGLRGSEGSPSVVATIGRTGRITVRGRG
jgi:pimeloyl-ACP methyl ester carboxylesterase